MKAKKHFFFIMIIAAVCIFLPSFSKAETLKIGFVTDWEYGKQKKYDHKLPKKATSYLKTAVNHYNKAFHPDLVVGGGDYVLARNVSKKTVTKQMGQINKVFQKSNAPRLYCTGNHDLSELSKEEVQKYLGIDYNHSVTDMNGVRVITLDTNFIDSGGDGYGMTGRMPNGEIEWLEEKLDTELPVIVFSHQSPISTPEGSGWRTNIYEAVELRSALEEYGNVVAVFSGHTAVNYSTEVNGINYVIINNLSDATAKNSFADITVEKTEDNVSMSVSQLGKKPADYSFSKLLSN